MNFKSFLPMVREGSDLDSGTRLLRDLRVVGANRSAMEKIPGYSVKDTSVAIDGGGTVTRGEITIHKDQSGNEYVFMISSNKLYYLKADHKWYEIDWMGKLTPSFPNVRFWYDRGTLHVGAGHTGVSAVYQRIDRKNSEGTGYFGDANEDFEGYFWGESELPKFIASEHFGFIVNMQSRIRKNTSGDYVRDFGIQPDTSNFIMGQFVYEGGQVSIPTIDSVLQIPPGLISSDNSFFSQIELIINQDYGTQIPYDKRLVGIDIYVAELPKEGIFNSSLYPDIPGEIDTPPERILSNQEFGSLSWKWLTRVKVASRTVLYQGVFTLITTTPATPHDYRWGSTGTEAIASDDDVDRNHFAEGVYDVALGKGIYIVEVRPIDGSSDWEELIFTTISSGTLTSGTYLQHIQVWTWDIPSGASGQDKYELRVCSKWAKVDTTNNHRACIQIIHYDQLGGKTISIDGVGYQEGPDWHKGASNADAANSLATALTGATAIVGSQVQNQDYFGKFQSCFINLDGSASFTITTNADTDDLVLSSENSGAGYTERKWRTVINLRRPPDSEVETADSILVAQPYSLNKEYTPKYSCLASQNRRTFYYDCTTRKRHTNMLMWSEINKPNVIPNKNYIFTNTYPGEESRGLVAIQNGLLALNERSIHLIRMTGEPIQYDAEEGKLEVGCLASRGIIEHEGVVYWLGYDGIKKFERGLGDITRQTFASDYKKIVDSEYSNSPNGYEDICSGVAVDQGLLVWSFPNCTEMVENVVVRGFFYDLRTGDIILTSNDFYYNHLTTGYKGELVGVNSTGIYDLFSATSSESVQGKWVSGVLASEDGNPVKVDLLRIRHKGACTVTIKRDGVQAFQQTMPTHSTSKFSLRQVNLSGDTLQVEVGTSISTDIDQIGRIELLANEVSR